MFFIILIFFSSCKRKSHIKVKYFDTKEFSNELFQRLKKSQRSRNHHQKNKIPLAVNGFKPKVSGINPHRLMVYRMLLERPRMFGMSKRQSKLLLGLSASSNMKRAFDNQ